ncbi:MAG: chemotaxis protein CheD [Acidimicrobiia bacterium]|nr:chemotaxis protein CheD [Acidimicrobiia bacterium]
MSAQIVVGIGDCKLAKDPDATLVTYALGSCIAVTVYDPVAKVGGLLHYMLPDSTIDAERARKNPYMYGDTGVPALFHGAYQLGAEKKRLKVHVAGGAHVLNDNGFLDIGKRNYLILKKLLWKAGVMVTEEAIGGTCYRTIRIHIASGQYLLQEGPVGNFGSRPASAAGIRRTI